MASEELIRRVMGVLAKHECFDDLIWNGAGEKLFVCVNDFFAYACADCEEITDDNIGVFEMTYDELAALGLEEYAHGLFAARSRNRKPVAVYLNGLHETGNDVLLELFDSIGV